VDNWLFQFNQFYEASNVTNDWERVTYAASFLRGPALTWWQTRREQVATGHEALIQTWEDFSTSIKEAFKPINATKAARDKLAKLRQRTSVQDYITEFRNLTLLIPDMSDGDKLDRFLRGLKFPIQKELA
jgi:hypothetical protein